MPTIKLLQSHRDFLNKLASDQVACPVEEAADKKAYAKAAPKVRKIVETKYPPKDMELLAKYQVASPDKCIRLQLTAGGVEQFCFREDDGLPQRPNGYGCGNHIYPTDEATTQAVTDSLAAASAFKKAREAKLNDYRALIMHSATLEQVEAVWPAAAALRPRLTRALPVVLSDEVIARIRADVAKPLKKAA